MEIKRNKKMSKKTLIIVFAAIAVIITGCVVYALYHQSPSSQISTKPRDANSVDYGSATDQQVQAGQDIKQNSVNGTGTDIPPSPTVQPGSDKKVAQISITAKNQTSDVYQIRFQIDALISGGTCSLTLTKGSSKVTKTAPVQNLSNTSTCQGFDVPLSELASGTWQLAMTADNSTISGTLNTTFTVQ